MNLRYTLSTVFLLLISVGCWAQKTVVISAGAFGDVFNQKTVIGNAQQTMYVARKELAKMGYKLEQMGRADIRQADYAVFFDDLNYYRGCKGKKILFLWEPPSVRAGNYDKNRHAGFDKVFTWNDDFVDNKKYFKFYYPQPKFTMIDVVPFKEKKLCTLITRCMQSSYPTNLYAERKKWIDFFEQQESNDFDFYGLGWNPVQYKNYKGGIDNKEDYLKKYKFCICYESNKGLPGYITEKIFDCFVAGCVPVYWGPPNTTEFISKNCFIDRNDFTDEQDMYSFMLNMSEQEYQQYIDAIKQYLQSEQAYKFSSGYFIETLLQAFAD